jgi:transposase
MALWRWCARRLGTIHFPEQFSSSAPSGADRIKIVSWDGSGLVLFWKRLEHSAFRWPPIADGTMRLTSSQLAALVDGMDWSRLHARDVVPPTATS